MPKRDSGGVVPPFVGWRRRCWSSPFVSISPSLPQSSFRWRSRCSAQLPPLPRSMPIFGRLKISIAQSGRGEKRKGGEVRNFQRPPPTPAPRPPSRTPEAKELRWVFGESSILRLARKASNQPMSSPLGRSLSARARDLLFDDDDVAFIGRLYLRLFSR